MKEKTFFFDFWYAQTFFTQCRNGETGENKAICYDNRTENDRFLISKCINFYVTKIRLGKS
jgi:hypothetical protein